MPLLAPDVVAAGTLRGADWRGGAHAHWAAADAVTDDLLGRVSLKNMDLICGQGEVAYWTVPARRRQDVASRAVAAPTRWAFDDVGFHRLELTHSVHNLPSSRVAIEAGFDFEGVKRCAVLHLDGWHDMHLHARINDTKLGMGNSVTEIHATTIDHSPAVTRLLALAIGDDPHCLQHVVRRYRDDPAAGLLVAVVDHDTAGVIGYSVGDSAVTLLHIATAPHARNAGVGTQLLGALRRTVPAGLSIVAETDQDAVGFYAAHNFAVTSLGEKYPGVERFRVQLRAPTNPKPDP